MQVTLGELGSGFSKPPPPRFLVPEWNMGEAWPPFKLPLLLSRRLREEVSEIWAGGGASLARAGLRMDLEEESFMEEEEEKREVKQIKSSLGALVTVAELLLLILDVRMGSVKIS